MRILKNTKKYILERILSFIMGLYYLNWKTYVFLCLALAFGAGAAPSKKLLELKKIPIQDYGIPIVDEYQKPKIYLSGLLKRDS